MDLGMDACESADSGASKDAEEQGFCLIVEGVSGGNLRNSATRRQAAKNA